MPNVMLSWLFPEEVSGRFAHSVADLLMHDRQTCHVGKVISLQSGPRVAEARSQLCDVFLRKENADLDWLLMLDSDMTFDADLLERMLAVADPYKVPVLGGLCFAGGRSGKYYPTIYRERQEDGQFVGVEPVTDYPRDALVKVGGTGAACLLIHRRVLLAMSQPWPRGFGTRQDGTVNPYPWFAEGLTSPDGRPFGEDIMFCRRAIQLGVPVHVDTRIKIGHVKSFELGESDFLRQQADLDLQTGDRASRRRAARMKVSARG